MLLTMYSAGKSLSWATRVPLKDLKNVGPFCQYLESMLIHLLGSGWQKITIVMQPARHWCRSRLPILFFFSSFNSFFKLFYVLVHFVVHHQSKCMTNVCYEDEHHIYDAQQMLLICEVYCAHRVCRCWSSHCLAVNLIIPRRRTIQGKCGEASNQRRLQN